MRKTTIAALAAAALIAVGCGSTSGTEGPGAQGAPATTADDTQTITIEVTGPKTADITYGLDGASSQDNGAKLPWSKELKSTSAWTLVSVIAQNKTASKGEIRCRILVGGKELKVNASKGEYAVVTCDGNL